MKPVEVSSSVPRHSPGETSFLIPEDLTLQFKLMLETSHVCANADPPCPPAHLMSQMWKRRQPDEATEASLSPLLLLDFLMGPRSQPAGGDREGWVCVGVGGGSHVASATVEGSTICNQSGPRN